MMNLMEFLESQKTHRPIGAYPVEEIDAEVCGSDIVEKYCTPMLGAEHYFPALFGKYGYTYCGICDGWHWHLDKLDNAPKEDIWEMVAISSLYWLFNYQLWHQDKEKTVEDLTRRNRALEQALKDKV